MYNVIGVRFKKAGKIYYFDPGALGIEKDDYVIVETARGVEYGKVVVATKTVGENDVVLPLKQVVRVATDRDRHQVEENRLEASRAFELGTDKIEEHRLDMKLVDVAGSNVHEALLMLQAEWLPLFKEKEDAERGLDMLLFAYRDIASVKAGLETARTYPDMEETWKQMALRRSFTVLSKQLQAVLQAKQQLPRNMNRTLLMEQLMLNLQEG